MPEGDYLIEVRHTDRAATWIASVRAFDFKGATTTVFSPAVEWKPEGPLSVALRYAVSLTDTATFDSMKAGR